MTDFGEDDYFVASLKGIIYRINPLARIINITHRVPSFDIAIGSFILFSCYRYFPVPTIFLVVVDPGVGSVRKILLAKTEKYFFIAPDNGVLSQVFEAERIEQMREVTNPQFFLHEISHTFEGRDKMAPVAAWLSKGVSCSEFGPEVKSYARIKVQKPLIKGKEIFGHIIYIDKFGNLISNVHERMLNHLREEEGKNTFTLQVGGVEIDSFLQSYSSGERGEFLVIIGSLGLVEVAAREASAQRKLRVKVGDRIKISLKD